MATKRLYKKESDGKGNSFKSKQVIKKSTVKKYKSKNTEVTDKGVSKTKTKIKYNKDGTTKKGKTVTISPSGKRTVENYNKDGSSYSKGGRINKIKHRRK